LPDTDADTTKPKAATAKQKAYAAWLLQEGYAPFDSEVEGYNGMLRIIAVRSQGLKPTDRQRLASDHCLEQFAIAEGIATGAKTAIPAGWPGKRPLTVQKRRVDAAKDQP